MRMVGNEPSLFHEPVKGKRVLSARSYRNISLALDVI